VLDFSKAFDKVPHQRLLHKLEFYGVGGPTKGWIASFLTGRSQLVMVDGESSEPGPVLSGVPQGTVMGPLLFLLYINDINSPTRLFADDCLIYREISSPDDSKQHQSDLDSLVKWSKTWHISFNTDKCFT